jgi:hypothetical protein
VFLHVAAGSRHSGIGRFRPARGKCGARLSAMVSAAVAPGFS